MPNVNVTDSKKSENKTYTSVRQKERDEPIDIKVNR